MVFRCGILWYRVQYILVNVGWCTMGYIQVWYTMIQGTVYPSKCWLVYHGVYSGHPQITILARLPIHPTQLYCTIPYYETILYTIHCTLGYHSLYHTTPT